MGRKFFKRTIRKVPLDHKTVLVRADYNVPLESDGSIADDFRIRASLPTIQALMSRGCKVVIVSHLGRPEGRDYKYSLEVVGKRLAELLGRPVLFVDDCIGDKVRHVVKKAPKNAVILLENLRYYPEEEANDVEFAGQIVKASGARYFVQDGFGVVHRAHASTQAITTLLPSVAGLLLEKEYLTITTAMKNPKRPLVAVMGGAKVSDKLALVDAFVEAADKVLIGGSMANTILSYGGVKLGKSKVEEGQQAAVDDIYKAVDDKVGADKRDELLVLPSDVAVAKSFSNEDRRSVALKDVASDDIALDIGDESIEHLVEIIRTAGTVIWNGPVGVTEFDNFAHGSARLALELATHRNIMSIIGGGDSADFVLHWDSRDGASFGHISTGGGASLELMAGDKLPGVESLLDA